MKKRRYLTEISTMTKVLNLGSLVRAESSLNEKEEEEKKEKLLLSKDELHSSERSSSMRKPDAVLSANKNRTKIILNQFAPKIAKPIEPIIVKEIESTASRNESIEALRSDFDFDLFRQNSIYLCPMLFVEEMFQKKTIAEPLKYS
ncbi:hypothetical protein NH340_JMT00208 [Sarcoptes scabiei]|nr:hypothetical protein NH340_JMT00208 [Sarcoptes scabiei]